MSKRSIAEVTEASGEKTPIQMLHDRVLVADGATFDVLTDDALMKAHRLELPFGVDPHLLRTP